MRAPRTFSSLIWNSPGWLRPATCSSGLNLQEIDPVQASRQAGVPVILEIEVQGARQVRERAPQATLVFIAPPSVAELDARLRGRGTEDEAALATRLEIAHEELAAISEFDHVLVNSDVTHTAQALLELVADPRNEDS